MPEYIIKNAKGKEKRFSFPTAEEASDYLAVANEDGLEVDQVVFDTDNSEKRFRVTSFNVDDNGITRATAKGSEGFLAERNPFANVGYGVGQTPMSEAYTEAYSKGAQPSVVENPDRSATIIGNSPKEGETIRVNPDRINRTIEATSDYSQRVGDYLEGKTDVETMAKGATDYTRSMMGGPRLTPEESARMAEDPEYGQVYWNIRHKYGITPEEYEKHQTEKINARIDDALAVAEELRNEAIADQSNWVIDIHGNRYNATDDQLKATIRAIKAVKRDLNASRTKYGEKDGWHFGKRFWDRGELLVKLTPVLNMIRSLESAGVTFAQVDAANQMIEDPESMTPEQKLLHSLTAIQQSVAQMQKDMGGKHYASTDAESISEMAEFMMGLPLKHQFAKGVIKSVTKGASKVLSKVAKEAVEETAEEVAGRATARALEAATGWRKVGNTAMRKVKAWGKSFGESVIGAPTQTLLYRSLADEALGQYQVRPDGSTIQIVTPAWERVYRAWLVTALELHSEDMGMWIGKGLNALGRRMANVGFVRNIMRIPASKSPLWEVVRKELKVSDPVSEAAGEFYGDAIQPLFTGDLNWDETFGDEDYWKSTIVASAGVSVALNLPNIKQYKRDGQRIQSLGRIMDSSLEAIENDNLRKQLITAVSHPSLEQQTKALATINWGDTSREDMACAMDYVYAHTQREMYYGAYDEVSRQEQLSQHLGIELSNSYRGESGRDSSMTTVKARAATNSSLPKDAEFYVIAGDYTAPDGFVTVIREDRDGSRTRDFVPVNQLEGFEEQDISAKIAEAYDELFSEQIADGEVSSLSQRIAEMRAEGVAEETIREIVSENPSYHEYKEGDVVTDTQTGEAVTINEQTSTGEYIATKANGQRITISYNEIADSGAYAQQAQTESDAVEEGKIVNFLDADGNTIEGEVSRVHEDGRVDVMVQAGEENGAPAYVGYTILPSQIIRNSEMPAQPTPTEQVAQDVASDVAAVAETTETPQVTAPQAEVAPVPDAREIPTLEDGSIDYDAIEDPQQFIDLYGKDMTAEELIADVTAFRDDATANTERLNNEVANAKTPNEKKALRDQAKIEANRANKYQAVLDLLMPKAPVAEQTEVAPEVTPVAEEVVEPVAEVAEQTPIAEEQMEVVAEQPTEVVAEQADEETPIKEQTESPVEEAKPTTPAKPKLNISEKENKRRIPLRRRANLWGRKVGVKVVLLESIDEVESKEAQSAIREAEKNNQKVSGWVDEGKVYLYLPHVSNTDEIDATYIHEVVAHIGMEEMMGEKEYQQFCLKVWDMMNEEERDYYYNYEGVRDNKNEEKRKARAADEYIAHLAERTNLEERDATMWEKIVDLFTELLAKLGYPKNISRLNIEDAIRESYRNLVESNVIIEDQSGAVSHLANKGAVVDAKRGDVKFAVRDILKGEEREQAIKDLMRVTGRNRATVEKYLQAEESLAHIILNDDNVAFLDLQVDESVPAIWDKNTDYPQGTVEFSNICRKRLPLTMIYQRLQKEFPNTVFDAATLETIRGVLKENGIDVACGLCFVEDRRQLLGEIGQGFIDAINGKNEDVSKAQSEALTALKDSGDTYVPTLYDLLTLDGMKALRKEHPDVALAFIKYNNARGMQAGRLFQAYSAYHREILKWSKAKVDKANRLGGLRIFSYSDFEAHHLIDLVQVLTDCSRMGIKVQGYTKVPEFARAIKDTKMKLNRSLIAKGNGVVDADYVPQKGEAVSPNIINGKRLLLDTVEGIDVNHKDFFDSSKSANVGNIIVGISDEHIKHAMADPFVDYIIPFHSGIKEETLKQKGIGEWKNYKLEQLEKIVNDKGKLVNADKHGINIYTEVLSDDIKTEKQFVEKYLDVCREKGWIPKFHRLLNTDKDGNFVYTKGYYKLLLDYKLFDQKGNILPQEVVSPIFDPAFNEQILNEYVEGEKAKAPNEEVYNKVKEALSERGTIRYRFIGEKGAANLDKAEEATIRLDNLNTARQMEEAQKSPKTIKMATGWERGADGKWRYEENDTVTAKTIRSLKGAGVKKIREARSQRIKQLDKFAYITHIVGVDQLYDEEKILATSWSEEQKKMWLDIYNMFKDDREGAIEYERKARAEIATLTSFGQGQFMLYEVLGENDSIFKAYPEMRNVKFWLKPYKGGKTFGGYNRLNNTIEVVDFRGLFENDKGEGSASTAAHEIQHIIQGYEGFARGGNMSMLDPNKENAKDTLVASMTEKFNESMAERDALWEQKRELDRKMENWWLDHTDATSEDMNNDPQMREWNKQYDEIIKKHNEAVKNVEFFKDRLVGAEEMDVTLGEDGYKRLAGEVEARNVERRRNMSMMERRNSPAWETEDVAHKDQIFISDALESEKAYAIGNNEQTQTLNAKQKNPSQEEVIDERDIQFRISKNNRTTINGWMNKRSDLTEADKGAFLDYIDDLDSKTQLATGKWFANGVIRVPEDMPKVEQAVKVAEIAKVDPLQFKSPMELINAHANIQIKEKPIDPDTVDTLFDRHEVGSTGIVTYEVEESEESRENMRKIINTHFGEEASPWCLLQGDGKGNLTSQSRKFWDHYNAYPKRVAFKDGKLLAFSANNNNERVWWDRQDECYEGIPAIIKDEGDDLGRSATFEYDETDGEIIEIGQYFKGNKQNGIYERWSTYDNDILIERSAYKDGKRNGLTEMWSYEGYPESKVNFKDGERDGEAITYAANGNIVQKLHYKNGLRHGTWETWNGYSGLRTRFANYTDGALNGHYERWHSNGRLEERGMMIYGQKDGLWEEWDQQGRLTSRTNYDNGLREGLCEIWINGILRVKAIYKGNKLVQNLLEEESNSTPRFRVAPTFYSNAENAVKGIKQEKATPEQWLKMIEKNGGLKAGEDKWLGLSDWLKSSDKKTLTKDEVLGFIKENQIQIEEVHYGEGGGINYLRKKYPFFDDAFEIVEDDLGITVYSMNELAVDIANTEFAGEEGFPIVLNENEEFEISQEEDELIGSKIANIITNTDTLPINNIRLVYTTNGLENKREIALTIPTIESWGKHDQVHFGDAGEGRAIAWIRFGETTDADGNRVLVIDEVQSKRHQEGRKKGYKRKLANREEAEIAFNSFYFGVIRPKYGNKPFGEWDEADRKEYQRLDKQRVSTSQEWHNKNAVPEAPFEKNWSELAMKRMLRYAAENGFDKVAWTKGDQQNARYSLGQVADFIGAGAWQENIYDFGGEDVEEVKFISIQLRNGGDVQLVVDRNGNILSDTNDQFAGNSLSDVVGKDLAIRLMGEGPVNIDNANIRMIGGDGMRGFYDRMLPAFMNKYGKKWGVKVQDVTLPNVEESGRTMHSVDVTDSMRDSVMQGQPMFRITPAMDKAYMDAVERGDMETAQRMVDEAAKAAGYTEKVYHGTPHFGFTTFDTQRSSGVIFTTNKRNVAANYAGDNNYASVRKVNKGYKEPKSISDIIENARSVFNQDWRLVTPTERETVINKVEAEAQRVEQKINSLRTDVPTEIEDNVAWVENIIYSAADGRENGNEGDEMQRMLFDDYEQFKENRNALREWIGEHRPELTAQQQQYLDYLIGYELGDVAIDANLSFANAFGSEELATVDGQSFTPISDLAAITGKAANIGAYELYGNLGHNPLVVNGEGHAWFNLRFNGMRSTDDIANWAKQNGYTSVIFEDISDYGDPSDVKVFFNPEQVKSADPVTYDDNGNVIPLSQRFNSRESDIRFRKTSATANRNAYNLIRKKLQNAGVKVHEVSEEQARQMAGAEYMIRKDGDISILDIPSYINKIEEDAFAITDESSEEVIFDVLKRLSELNASAYKGYGELTIEQNNANVAIYRSKENILRHLVGIMVGKGLDVSAWDGVLYYRNPNGVQLSYHIIGPRQSEYPDYIPMSIVKPTEWDGIRKSWKLSPEEYARKVEERRAKIDADNLLMQDRVERIKSALLKVMKNGSLARKYGIGKSYADIKATDIVVGFNNDRSFQGIEYIIGRLIGSRTPYRIEQLVLEQLGYDSSREEERYFEGVLNLPPTRYFYRTNGTIYGWAVGGEIYLTPDGLNANTAIHEYSHLWVEALRKKDSKKWAEIKSQLQATSFWQQVLDDPNYENIREDEDAVASEVLARLSGNKGAERLANEAQRIIDAGNGNIMARIESTALVQRVKRLLRDFYAWVARNVFGLTNETTISRVADMVVDDLVNEVHLDNIINSPLEAMFIGENGALNLDIAERVANRVNGLDVAIQMSRDMRSSAEIKLATGWEQGADGAWRYEISDKDVHLNMEAMSELNTIFDKNEYRQRNAERIRMFEESRPYLAEKRRDLIEKYSEKSSIVEAFDDLYGLTPVVAEFKLRDLIDYDEAFDAYPKLGDINVRIIEGMDAQGEHWEGNINLSIETSRIPVRMRAVLLHEIQHAIQGYEGFAVGGSVDSAKKIIDRLERDAQIYEFAQKIKREMERFPESSVSDASLDVVNDMVIAAGKNEEDLIAEGRLDPSIIPFAEHAVNNPAEMERVRDSYNILFTLLGEDGTPIPYKAYKQLMGEVEARNTMTRRNMSAEERAKSLAMYTEDVSRENQILRYRKTATAMEEDQIILDAKANGTYLKAPNGKPTNLTPKQWVQVRTKAFKRWFGDWESNPDNASKIVDANGEPLVVWHGGSFAINDFTPNGTMHFGTKVAALQRVLDQNWGYGNWEVIRNADGTWGWKYTDPDAGEYEDEDYSRQSDKYFTSPIEALEDATESMFDYVVRPYFLNIRNEERVNDMQDDDGWDNAVSNAIEMGSDGLVYSNDYEDEGNDSFVAFYPIQIKSAEINSGEFDPTDPDIRYRKVYYDAEGNPVKASPISAPKKKLEKRPFRPDSKAGRAFDALWRAFADSQTIVGEYVDGLLQKIGEKEIQRRQQKAGFGFTKREMESLPARIRNKFRNANPIKAYNKLSKSDQILVAKVLSKFNPLIDYMSAQNRSESRGEYEMRSYIENHINPLNEARQRLRDVMGVNDLELEAYVSGEHSLERHKSGIDALSVDEEREWSVGKVTKLVDDFHKRLRNNVKRIIAVEGIGFFTLQERKAMGRERKAMGSGLYDKMVDVGFDNLSEEEQNIVLEAPLEIMWSRIRALNDTHLGILLRAGRYSKEDIDRIKSHNWKYYVPLYGHDVVFENLSDPTEVYEFAYRGGSPSNNISFKKAEGRSSKAQDIFLNMYQLGQRCIAFEARNNAKRALLDFTRWTNNQLGVMGTRNLWYEKLSYQVKGEDGKWHSTDAIPSREELAEMRKLNQQISGNRRAVLHYNNRINSIEELTEAPSSQDAADKLDAELRGLQSKREEALRKIKELEEKKTWDVKRSNGFDAESPSTKDKVEADRTIKVWVDGREVRLVFNDPDVARAVNGTKVWAAKGWAAKALSPIAWLTRARAQFNTQFSPDFIISNSLRDFQHALIAMMLAEQGSVSISFMKNYVSHIASAFRSHVGIDIPIPSDVLEKHPIYYSYEQMRSAYLEALKSDPNITEEDFEQGYRDMVKANRVALEEKYGKRRVKDTLLEAFRAYGGATGFVHSLNEQAIQKQFREAMLLKNETIVRRYVNPISWARGLANVVSVASEAMEDITRFATFLSHLDSGKSVEEAAQEAKEITTNFNRKGELSSGMGTLYMFFNASIQGSAQVMRLIKQHPRRAMAVMPLYAFLGFAQRITKGMLWKALAFWTIRGLLDDDDELRSIEQLESEVQIPDYIYGDNMIFTLYRTMDALDEVATSGYFLRIPQPNGFRAAYKVGVELGELALGEQSLRKLPLSMASTVAGELIYGYNDTGEIGSDLGRMFIPSPAQPAVDLFLNRDFVNRTIYNERTYKPTAPTYTVAKKGTPQIYVEMSKALNSLLGGTDTRSADYNNRWEKRQIRLDIPPEAFEYMVNEMFGGLGTFSNRLMTTVELMFKGEDVPLRKIPFVNRVAGEFEPKNVWPEYKALTDQVDLAWQETAAFRTEEGINMTRKEWKDPSVTYPYMIEHYKDDPNMVEMLRKRWLLKGYFKEVSDYSDALKSLGEGGDAVDRASESREMTEQSEKLQADRTLTEKYILEVAKHVDWQAPTNEEVLEQLERVENTIFGD